MEASLKKLRLQRGQLKGTVTRIENFVNDPINLTSSSVEMLEARKDKLLSTMRSYETVQLDILSFDPEDPESVAQLEEKYYHIISKLDSSLRKLTESEVSKCPNVASSKLPNIEIPVFSGKDFTKYTPFMDLFIAVFHNNKQLSDVQKLFYLRTYLSEEALAVIVNLPLVNESYKEAIYLLKKRYDNKARLISNHINIILEMPSMQRGTAASLRSFISEVQQQIKALKNLKQPIEQWDMLLVCILTKKLDQYTNRAFQLERDPEPLPTLVEFIKFLEKRANAFEESGDKTAHESISKRPFKVTNVAAKSSPGKVCKYCDKVDHSLFNCPKFKTAADVVRIKFVDDHKLCTVCLNEHKGRCRFHFKCKICKSGHNTLLHKDGNADQEQTVALHTSSSSTQVLLPTIKVKLFDSRGRTLLVRALLDSGSQASFITHSLMKRLSLNSITQSTNIIGIGNKNNIINKYVNIVIHSPVQDMQFHVKCNVVDAITTRLPQQYFDLNRYSLPKGIYLSDDKFNVPTDISLLLGADLYFNILLDGHIKLVNGPVLQNTLFGYVVGGTVSNLHSDSENLVSNFAICDNEKLENVMEQFWLTERIPEPLEKENKVTAELQKAESIFQKSVQIKNNKFFVDMPLVTDLNNLELGDSFSVALPRFLALERKLRSDANYFKLYKKFIDEYLALGHAKIVDIGTYDIQNGPVFFLSHHAVINENSKTTKLRVVFNGSMKSKNKLSLNDVMLNGPIVQSELFDILVLFRTYIYTLICDVSKMFRAVHINKHQLSLQNILWRDDARSPISCLQLQTVTYGLKASTYLATRCLIELAQRYGETYPLAAQAMRYNTYTDDVLSGTDDRSQLCELKRQLVELLSKGSFTLHKWCSNVPEILNDIPSEHKYFEEIDINKNNIIKTLGLKYDIIPDQFTFTSPDNLKKDLQTKRSILSYIGKMFDPLGLIGPIIVVAKLFMQELWSIKIGWDTVLPPAQLEFWRKFMYNLSMMGTISVPRCLSRNSFTNIQLVGYADASIKAFGCCLYLRVVDEQNSKVYVNLICSKSRVAPMGKTLTIPKLELNSAVLLSQLAGRVFDILKTRFSLSVHLYSDSQIVLAWLTSTKPIRDVYVSKRIKQMHELTKGFEWSYVRSADNPADLLSRGSDPQKLKSSNLWWCGPANLADIEFTHSHSEFNFPIPSINEETTANVCTTEITDFSLFEKYSSLYKLQKLVALLLRFKNNCINKNGKAFGPLGPKDLDNSLNVIIRAAQIKHLPSEIQSLSKGKTIKSGLANLHPFLDESNILRVGGRLQNATNMSYDKKHPAIIPKSSHIASMLVEREHLRLLHAGPKLVLSSLSQKYYLISGIREVKKVVHKCVTCHRVKAAAAKQLMGSLPKERLTETRPFQTAGLDFCGPFSIKVARIRNPLVSKAYVALFICFVTKAIHVELVTDLSTEAFLACLKRFIARRGLPNCIFCDNATTFKGASNTLKGLYDLFNSKTHKDAVINYCLEKCIQFKFIPSYSPEFGGLWEAGVKSLKFHLKRIVGNLCLTYEGLNTVITEIEAILNSRPLLPMSSDISDTNYLTPGHFLIGQAMTSYPELDLTNENVNRLKFWNVLTKLKQDFWKAWSRDYLTQLQSRPKWIVAHPNLKVGDLVIVRSDNTAPLKWPMGRIVKVFPGSDGKVRVAEIRIGNKTYTRSYRKLSPLPIN